MKFFGNHSLHYHLYTDNQAAEHIATQPTMTEHSRSIDLRHHSIRQDYLDDLMRIGGVSSKDNTSDILTKSLQPDLYTRHTTSLFPDRQSNIHAQQESSAEQRESSNESHPKPTTPNAHHHHNMVTYTHITRNDARDNPTLRQARQQWVECLTQHDRQLSHHHYQSRAMRHATTQPSLRQARQLWVDYIKQHDRPPTPAAKPETPHHTQNKRDLKTLHKHTHKSKRGRKQLHQKETPKNKSAHTNQKRQMTSNQLTNQTVNPNSHLITLKRDQPRSPILVPPAKHSKHKRGKRRSRTSSQEFKFSTNHTLVYVSHLPTHLPTRNQSPSPDG
jgi:hypothetical protein